MSRVGNFSSSEIWKLMTSGRKAGSYGAPFYTYIKEKRWERGLMRPLSSESNAKPTNWGTFLEKRVFDLLPFDYKLVSKDRYQHTEINSWTGMPDTLRDYYVGDIKCPWTLTAFCTLVDAMKADNFAEELKSVKKEYYWQLVSNAILTGKDRAELIVYAPYKSEMEEIREMARNYDGDQNKIAFIEWMDNSELPVLKDEGKYQNLNRREFIIPEEDKTELYNRVLEAHKLLE